MLLSTKATDAELTTFVFFKVFYERRRERQAARGQYRALTDPKSAPGSGRPSR